MDSHTLQAFVSVAKNGSFSQAANELFLTQPAISKRIALLESQLNSRLFDRIGRSVTLTEAGSTLLPKARAILTELEDAQRAIHNLSGNVEGRLCLAASHHVSLHRLPPILKKFTSEYPKVNLDLRFYESEVAYEGVLRGELELALITLAPNPDPAIYNEVIWQDPLYFAVSKEHPLATQSAVSLELLNQYPAILPSNTTFTRQLVESMFQRQKLTPNVSMSTNYLDTIRMMVSIGLGWSLLPRTLIDDSLVTLPIREEPISRTLGFIYHRNRTLSNAAIELVELLRKNAAITCYDSGSCDN